MNYTEAMDYMNQVAKYGSVLGLESMKELLKRIGNPQDQLKIIHIAGTNGKGSTLAFLSSILTAAGYKTGRYISPTIFEYLERIQIDETYIAKESFAELLTPVRDAAEAMTEDGFAHPTPFEIETAVSFLYFYQQKCDVVVLETGLGGTLDATNVMKQVLCSVITSISMDHMRFLGNTIEEIAENKAGIILKNCPVVLYRQTDAVMNVIKRKAKELEADLVITNNSADVLESTLEGQTFSYSCTNGKEYANVQISMAAPYQIQNCITALETVQVLKEQGYCFEDEAVMLGCRRANWHGRFEVVQKDPLFIVDGAHNPGAAKRLKEAIEMYLSGKRIIFLMGVMADKDYTQIIEMLAPYAEKIFTVTPNNPRSLDAKELAKQIAKVNQSVVAEETVEQAVFDAKKEAKKDGVVLSFGSLYYVGDTIRALKK